jgi:peptidyl-prolyl cis-trans isomerase C
MGLQPSKKRPAAGRIPKASNFFKNVNAHTERVSMKISSNTTAGLLMGVCLLVVSALTAFSAETPGVAPEGSAAVVNGTAITWQEVEKELDSTRNRMAAQGRVLTDAQLPELRENILDGMITRELLFQESGKEGIRIAPETVKEQLGEIKTQFPDEATYQTRLTEMAVTEADISQQILRGLTIEELIDIKVGQKIVVSEAEGKRYYDENPNFFQQPEQVHARHILIKVAPDADDAAKAEARKSIEAVEKKVKAGEDFEALAMAHSQGPSGPKGGDLGFFGRGQMVPPFEEAAFALEPGKVSGIVETEFGYHLIQNVEKKPAETISFETAKDQITEFLKQEKLQSDVERYVEDLKKTAKIERFPPKSS